MDYVQTIKDELQQFADKDKAEFLSRYFKVYPGGHGSGDIFIGVTVPNQRMNIYALIIPVVLLTPFCLTIFERNIFG